MTFVLLESLRPNVHERQTFVVDQPEKIIECRNQAEVKTVLKEIEQHTKQGWTAFGYLSYESGYAFLPNLPEAHKNDLPLLWFALSKTFRTVLPPNFFPTVTQPKIQNLHLNQTPDAYIAAIEKIKNHIARGDTYQVNYTMRYEGTYEARPHDLYAWLRQQQKVNYAAFIETPDWAILSFSPELFFRRDDLNIEMRPMKGTAPRGRTLEEDAENAAALRHSIKEQSENLMIVDLLRNDLGKICNPGSVQVVAPMEVEQYETLLQMTSTVTGTLNEGMDVSDILQATFPSGSVTGAPKIRTMQIIHELEKQSRGIYTGSIGWWSANQCVFNVAIRTVTLNQAASQLVMGVGSGILFEADPAKEYSECKLKAQFLTVPKPQFDLFETMLWEPHQGFRNLTFHLERIERSAQYSLFKYDPEQIQQDLDSIQKKLQISNKPSRVRLKLSESGESLIETEEILPLTEPVRVVMSEIRTDSKDRFLYHKTTARHLYEAEYLAAKQKGYFDVIFRNERDEITEGAISNIFIEKNGTLFTPPINSGLLAGTFRRFVLQSGDWDAQEKVLTVEDLKIADRIYASNAIRGLVEVRLDL
jgi:para-aminobenzoate synthetase/4-amino-4-deoxychorismate lyase